MKKLRERRRKRKQSEIQGGTSSQVGATFCCCCSDNSSMDYTHQRTVDTGGWFVQNQMKKRVCVCVCNVMVVLLLFRHEQSLHRLVVETDRPSTVHQDAGM